MTENHPYNTPEKGATDWHIPLNENFERLDTDVEIRDVEADRGDYTPKSGAKFFATDTGAEFIGDGSAWNRIAASGERPSVTALSFDSAGNSVQRELLETYSKSGTGDPFAFRVSELDGFDYYDVTISLRDASALRATLTCTVNDLTGYNWVSRKRASFSFKNSRPSWELLGGSPNTSGVCELRVSRTQPTEYRPGRITVSARDNFAENDVGVLQRGWVDTDQPISSITIKSTGEGESAVTGEAWLYGISTDF